MMNQAYRDIHAVIESVRRKRRAKRTLLVALTVGAVVLACLLAAALLLPALTGVINIAVRLALLLALAGAALTGTVAVWLKRETLADAARAIERVNPALKNDLISALQLTSASRETGPAGAFSRDFLGAHLQSTAALLPGLDLENAAPSAPLKRPALAGAAIFTLLLIAVLFAPGRSGRGLAALFTDPWSNPEAAREQAALPLTTGDFTAHYRFPAYSEISDQTAANMSGDLAALKGTLVTLETRVLEPLRSADLVTSGGARYNMTVTDRTRLRTELAISDPGTYLIEGIDEDGARRVEVSSHRIVVDEDLPPQATIVQPVGDMEVAVEDILTVRYEASDDFGLAEVRLVFDLNGREETVPIQSIKEAGRKRLDKTYDWVIADQDFKPGDRVSYYIEVLDNDGISGPKAGRSDLRVLEIFSARKEHRKLLAKQDELLNMMIDHLAAHLVAETQAQDPALDLRESERELLARGSELVTIIEDLYNELLEDEYADQMVVDSLSEMQSRYFFRLAERSKLMAADRPLAAAERAQLLGLRGDYRVDLENDVLFLDRLIKKQRVDDLLSEMDELNRAQSDLADLLAEYDKTKDPEMLDEIRRAMADLEQAWQNLMDRMAEMRKDMPEEFVNTDAFKGSNVMDLESQMEMLRKALADGDMDSVRDMANQLMSQMDQWRKDMEDNADDFNDMISKEMSERLSQVERELEELIKQQMAIEDGVSELYEEGMERAVSEKSEQKSGPDLDEALERLRASLSAALNTFYLLRRGGMAGKPQPVTPEFNEERRGIASGFSLASRNALALGEQAAKGNLERARETGEMMQEEMRTLRDDVENFADKHDAGPSENRARFHENMNEAEDALEEVMKKLEKIQGETKMSLTPEQQRRLQELAEMQKQNRERTESVKQSYDELQSEIPALPSECSGGMGQASQKMYDSAGEMELGEAGRAQLPSREARIELEKAMDALGQAKQKMQKSGSGGPSGSSPGMMSSGRKNGRNGKDGDGGKATGDIKLPDEDAYRVPEQFRQELLRAMKEGSPDAYKNLNKDYYERLVR